MPARLMFVVLAASAILSYTTCARRQKPGIGTASDTTSQVVPAPESKHTYSKWEYKIISVNGRLESSGDLYEIKNALTALGAEGLELVCSVEGFGSSTALLLKRPMQSRSDTLTKK